MLGYFRVKKQRALLDRIRHQAFLRITEGARHFDRLAEELRALFPDATESHIWSSIAIEVSECTRVYNINDAPSGRLVAEGLANDDPEAFYARYYANRSKLYCKYQRDTLKAAYSGMLHLQLTDESKERRWQGAIKALKAVETADDRYCITLREELSGDCSIPDLMPITRTVWLMAIKEVIRQSENDPEIISACRKHWTAMMFNYHSEVSDVSQEVEAWSQFLARYGIPLDGE